MCHSFAFNLSFASRQGKPESHDRENDGGLTWHCLFSDGTVNFSIRILSKTLAFVTKLATLKGLALALFLVWKISSSLISWAHIPSRSSTVTAPSNLYRTGTNSSANDGFWLRFHVHKQSLLLNASKRSTNLCYKGKRICMITIIHYYDDRIMPTFITRL